VGYLGVVLGDWLVFRMGRRLGPRIETHPRLGKLVTPERRQKIEAHFAKHGVLTVVVGRHTPGLRAPIFLVAGNSGMREVTFLLADAVSALVTVPLVVWIGYKLADLAEARHALHRVELWAAAGLAVAILATLSWRALQRKPPRLRMRRQRKRARIKQKAPLPRRGPRNGGSGATGDSAGRHRCDGNHKDQLAW